MTEQTIPANDEISLLDILVILAESWKLMVFGPLICGALALGFMSVFWVKTFESVAIVRMTEKEAELLHAAPVLDQLSEKFGLLVANPDREILRERIKNRLTFVVNKKTEMVSITAKADTANQAEALLISAIDAALKESALKGEKRITAKNQLEINEDAIKEVQSSIDDIKEILGKPGVSMQTKESSINNLAKLIPFIVELRKENELIRSTLEPKVSEIYLQKASPTPGHAWRKIIKVGCLSILFSAFALFLYVLVRKAISSAAKNPETIVKFNAIRSALGLKIVSDNN